MTPQYLRFPARIWWENEWWLVEVPYFDAVTKGENLDDARWMAADLVRMYLADWRGQGLPVDPPAELPDGEGWEWTSPYAPGEKQRTSEFGVEESRRSDVARAGAVANSASEMPEAEDRPN